MSSDKPAHGGDRPPLYKRQFIVNKPFQYRLIGTLIAVWAANSLFFAILLFLLLEGHLNQFYDLVPREGTLPLMPLPALVSVTILFVAVFGFVVLGLIGVYMSNQIAGPLYRTKKCLDRVGQGDLAFKLQFRHGDFLPDIPSAFNAMLEGLRQQSVEELEELKAIEASLEDPRVRERLEKLREKKQSQMIARQKESAAVPEEHEPVSVAVH